MPSRTHTAGHTKAFDYPVIGPRGTNGANVGLTGDGGGGGGGGSAYQISMLSSYCQGRGGGGGNPWIGHCP